MAPTIGAVRYSQASLKLPVATIGPSARARVEGRAREGSTHNDVEGQLHSDRQRCEAAGAARNRRAEHDCNQEKGERGLDHETCFRRDREGRDFQSEVARECGHAEAGGSAAQNGPQQERAGDTADELADDVADRFADAHCAGGEHAYGDGGFICPPDTER